MEQLKDSSLGAGAFSVASASGRWVQGWPEGWLHASVEGRPHKPGERSWQPSYASQGEGQKGPWAGGGWSVSTGGTA